MSRIACFVLLGLAAALAAGCDNAAPAAGEAAGATYASGESSADQSARVAVIDIDEIARRLGSDLEIVNQVKQRETQLNKELEALQVSYTQQLDDRKRELNYKPTDEQNRELQQLDANLGAKLQQARLDAQRELVRHQGALVTRLRERVRPVAREVAHSHGMNMIVVKNLDVLFDFDSGLDITSEVAEKLLAQEGQSSSASGTGLGQQGPAGRISQDAAEQDYGRRSSAQFGPLERPAADGTPRPFPSTAEQPLREMPDRR